MLELEIPEIEIFIEQTQEFKTIPKQTLKLEHSLLSISKWESKWKIPYLSDTQKTREQQIDYIRCMTINQINDDVYKFLPVVFIKEINSYINDILSATTIHSRKTSGHSKSYLTSEQIYSWMVRYGIPFECEKWHISRLMKLIDICSIENSSPDMMNTKDIYAQNRQLNELRRAKYKTKG